MLLHRWYSSTNTIHDLDISLVIVYYNILNWYDSVYQAPYPLLFRDTLGYSALFSTKNTVESTILPSRLTLLMCPRLVPSLAPGPECVIGIYTRGLDRTKFLQYSWLAATQVIVALTF